MRARCLVALSVLLCLGRPAVAQTHLALATGDGVPSLAPLLEKVIPAVVSVKVIGIRQTPVVVKPASAPDGDPMVSEPKMEPFRSGGSGVVVDAEKGIILTNVHVVADAVRMEVGLSDGRNFPAKVLGTDPATDVAVIKIEADRLTSLPLGNSDALKVGDFIIAVGNPFGLESSASTGIVSAKMRSSVEHAAFESYLQIDAAINPGNSGGALVDLHGRLVGINTATGLSRSQGISFAIPINMASSIGAELIKAGKFQRGGLGLIPGEMTKERASARGLETLRGAYISEVAPQTMAGQSGIKVGDIILAVDGTPIATLWDFIAKVVSTPIGQTLKLNIATENGRREFTLPIISYTAVPKPETAPESLASLKGLYVGPLLPGFAAFGTIRGVRVLKLEDGPLQRLGLKPDDVITEINGTRIDTPAELFSEVRDQVGQYRLHVTRGERKGIVYVNTQQ